MFAIWMTMDPSTSISSRQTGSSSFMSLTNGGNLASAARLQDVDENEQSWMLFLSFGLRFRRK